MNLVKGEHAPAPAAESSPSAAQESAPPTPTSPKPNSFGERFAKKAQESKPAEETKVAAEADETVQVEADVSQPSPNKERIKVNGEWKEIDFSDREAIKKELSLAHGARKWATELDKERKEKARINEDLAKYKKAMETFENLSKTNPEELWKRMFDKAPEVWLAEKQKERDAYKSATPEMREAMDAKKLIPELRRQMEEEKAAREALAKQAEEAQQAALAKSISTTMDSAFSKVRFTGTMKDKVAATELDRILYNTVRTNLIDYVSKQSGEFSELPADVVAAEFERVAKFLGRSNKEAVAKAVADTDKARAERAKANAQLTSQGQTKPKTNIVEELKKFGGRPSDYWKQKK
jgi:multidrug efflux pump subunit AcrB